MGAPTAKQQARYLFNRFLQEFPSDGTIIDNILYRKTAKNCALLCCDEIMSPMGADRGYAFYAEVKEELKKLE